MKFTEEQLAFRDSVQRMAERHVAPIAAEVDEKDRFPLELVKLFGEIGLIQLWVPERYGTKLSINQILKDRVNHLLEASMALEQVTFATADHKEATRAFKEKRKPKFTAR